MTTTLRVLSVGAMESCNLVRDALLQRQMCHLLILAGYRELCAISSNEQFDVAILHHTLSERDLRDSAERLRRHWPTTRILLINPQSEIVDDPLYDEWARPGLSLESLLLIIERLANDAKRERLQSPEGRKCAIERRK